MKTPEEFLKSKITTYNSEVNDMQKFALNERELKMFIDAMREYAEVFHMSFTIKEIVSNKDEKTKIITHITTHEEPIVICTKDYIGNFSRKGEHLFHRDKEYSIAYEGKSMMNIRLNDNDVPNEKFYHEELNENYFGNYFIRK